VVIMIERSEVQLVGRDDVQRWDLRTTSVFRRVAVVARWPRERLRVRGGVPAYRRSPIDCTSW